MLVYIGMIDSQIKHVDLDNFASVSAGQQVPWPGGLERTTWRHVRLHALCRVWSGPDPPGDEAGALRKSIDGLSCEVRRVLADPTSGQGRTRAPSECDRRALRSWRERACVYGVVGTEPALRCRQLTHLRDHISSSWGGGSLGGRVSHQRRRVHRSVSKPSSGPGVAVLAALWMSAGFGCGQNPGSLAEDDIVPIHPARPDDLERAPTYGTGQWLHDSLATLDLVVVGAMEPTSNPDEATLQVQEVLWGTIEPSLQPTRGTLRVHPPPFRRRPWACG